jgi:hypothetical protein
MKMRICQATAFGDIVDCAEDIPIQFDVVKSEILEQ